MYIKKAFWAKVSSILNYILHTVLFTVMIMMIMRIGKTKIIMEMVTALRKNCGLTQLRDDGPLTPMENVGG